MKYIFLIVYSLFSQLTQLYGQIIQWEMTFGGTRDEVGNNIQLSDFGGYEIFGSASSNNGDVIGHHLGTAPDAWLFGIDSNRNIISQKCFGGISGEDAFSGLQLTNGKIFIGSADFDDGDVSGVHNSQDIWIVRSDSSYQIIWQRCYGYEGLDYSYKIISANDNGFIFLGQVPAVIGGDVNCMIGETDLWVVKIDSFGSIEWQTCLGSTMHDNGSSIISSRNGGYYVYGGVSGNDGNVTCLGTVWLVRLNDSGNIIWDHCYPSEQGTDLVEFPNGNLSLLAVTATSSIPGYSGTDDYWIYKTDSLGAIINSFCYGGSWIDEPTSIAYCADGGVIAAGTTQSNDGLASGNHGMKDAFIVKLDSAGNREWSQCYGGSQDDIANSIVQTPDGGFVFTGSTESSDGDITSVPHGGSDLWVVKIAPALASIYDIENPISQLCAHFQEGKCTINFSSKTYGDFNLRMFDLLGKEIYSQKVKSLVGKNEFTFDIQTSSGIKILQLQNSSSSTTIKFFVK